MTTRRQVMKLAAFAASQTALMGAVRAEGGVDPGPAALSPLPFAQQTPMRIGAAALRVRDLGKMRTYYTDLLKLDTIRADKTEVVLGVDGVALLHLIHRPDAPLEAQTTAGLFHTAFLMPTRKDLARWLVHVAKNRVPLAGFADHRVSESVYLDDPEGNGIEVYADRAPELWQWTSGSVTMATDQLDVDDLLTLTDPRVSNYATAPDGLRIGHVHLRVGDLDQAHGFYNGLVGLMPTRRINGAAFLSSGRYHHHLATNVWQSAGAGRRDDAATGLAWFSMEIAGDGLLAAQAQRLRQAGTPTTELANGLEAVDPWGTRVRLIGV
jgi:catechol 2,3-dioxygenase